MPHSDSIQPAGDYPALVPLGSHAAIAPIPLKRPITLIGRRKEVVRLHLESSTVSKAHCAIVLNDWGCYIHDLGSRTHTWVNGQQITDADLADGDVVQIGRFQFKYVAARKVSPKTEALAGELVVSTLTDSLPVNTRVFRIGRRPSCDLQFDEPKVSNIHALLFACNGQWIVRDLASRTGVWLGGQPVRQAEIDDGSRLKIGSAVITFRHRHLDFEADDGADDDVAAPLTLGEALPAITAEPADDFASPPAHDSLAGALNFAPAPVPPQPIEQPLALADPVAEFPAQPLPPELVDDFAGDEIPGDDIPSADALASLRRGWRAPASEDAIPLSETHPPAARARPFEPPVVPVSESAPLDDDAAADLLERLGGEPEEIDLADLLGDTPLVPDSPSAKAETPHALPPLAPHPVSTPVPAPVPFETVVTDEFGEIVSGVIPQERVAETTPPGEVAETVVEVPLPTDEAVDESLTALDPLTDELPATSATEAADDFAMDLEPLAPDEKAEVDLTTPVADAGFPLDEAVAESAAVIDPVLDELPVAQTAPVETPPEPVAETPAAEPVFEAELEPLELDDAEPELIAPVDDAAFPLDTAVAEVSPVVDPVLDELPAADAPAADAPVVAAEIAPEPATIEAPADAEIEPGLDLEPINFAFVEAPAAPADVFAEASPEIAPVSPEEIAELKAEVPAESDDVEVFAAPVTDDELDASGEQPEPVAELADIDFEFDIEPPAVESAAAGLSADPGATVAETPDETLVIGELPPAEARPEPEDKIPTEAAAESPAVLSETAPAEIDSAAAGLNEEDAFDFFADESATAAAVVAEEDEIVRPVPPRPITPLPAPADEASVEIFDASPGESFGGLSLESADEEEPAAVNDSVTDTAMAVDLSAFIDGEREDDDEDAEWEDAAPPAEPVMEAGEEMPPVQGGTLRDLIPDHSPLIGGMFTPEGPMMIGGSPVVNFNAPPPPRPAPPATPSAPAHAVEQPARRRPLRVGFGGRTGKPSPFARGETSIVSDALAGTAAAESVDVFATPSPTAQDVEALAPEIASVPETVDLAEPSLAPVEDDVAPAESFVETAEPAPREVPLSAIKTEEDEIQAVAELFRPRPQHGMNGHVPTPFGQVPIPVAPRSQDDPVHAAQVRRARYRRIIGCLVATVPLAVGGVFAVYHFVQPYAMIDAKITYAGLDRLGIEDASTFRGKQNEALQSEQIRQKAIELLPAEATYGFLRDGQSLQKTLDPDPSIRWPADESGVMRLRIKSFDKAGDMGRMRALAQALIVSGGADKVQADLDAANAQIRSDTASSERKKRQLDDVNATLQDLQQAGNSRPGLDEIARLQNDRKKADDTLTSIKSTRQELEASVQVLQRPESVSLAPQTQVDVAQSDAALADLSQQLAQVQKQSETDKADAAGRSAAARTALDNSIAQFQNDLKGAQQLKQSPELAAYVDAANRIFLQTRELTEDLIRRQENYRTRLTELRARLAEKNEANTKDRIAKDEELKKLNDRLAIETRQLNAATAEGDTINAKKNELDIQLVKSLIGAREDLAKNDPVYNEAAEQLQAIIDQTEQTILDDRKHIDEKLTSVQADFARSAPAVEKLPDEQKVLKDSIEQKLADVNDKRKAYDAAADQAQAAQVKIEQDQKDKATALQLQIAARKQEVLDVAQAKASHDTEAARQQKLAATQDQLAQVRLKEQAAQQQLDAAGAAIDSAEKQRKAFVDSDLLRNEKQDQKQTLERDLKQIQSRLAERQAEVARLIVPDPKIEMQSYDSPDNRPIYAAGVGSGIFVLMMLPVLYTLMLTSRDAHHGHTPPPPDAPATLGFDPILPDVDLTADEDKADHVKTEEQAV